MNLPASSIHPPTPLRADQHVPDLADLTWTGPVLAAVRAGLVSYLTSAAEFPAPPRDSESDIDAGLCRALAAVVAGTEGADWKTTVAAAATDWRTRDIALDPVLCGYRRRIRDALVFVGRRMDFDDSQAGGELGTALFTAVARVTAYIYLAPLLAHPDLPGALQRALDRVGSRGGRRCPAPILTEAAEERLRLVRTVSTVDVATLSRLSIAHIAPVVDELVLADAAMLPRGDRPRMPVVPPARTG
ncbi:hypothetical protein [Nocardia nova]|uniref:hypothetical protein n=1 Tax=Nocardia nova TaxID=37330 RepID=UPI0033E0B133